MKGYTDIEQSKKLAEILPLESADMWWNFYSVTTDDTTPQIIHLDTPWVSNFNWNNKPDNVPCWSLSALLDVLPKNLNIGRPSLDSNYMEYYWIQYYDEFMKPNNYKTECFNNPIDACVDMIIKLHELNLL